jgi:hypothetical protein
MLEGVYKVYSGKNGACMCGCAGKYSYTAEGAEKHGPGYDVSDMVSERSVKIIAGKLLRNPNAKREDDYVYVVQNDRILVAYFAK